MKTVKYFGCDTPEEFFDSYYPSEHTYVIYRNKDGIEYSIFIWADGCGTNAQYRDGSEVVDGLVLAKGYEICSYASFDDMLNNYVMPDGVKMIDVWHGENYSINS